MKLINTITAKFRKAPPSCGLLHPDGIGECCNPANGHTFHIYRPEGDRFAYWWTT